MSETYIKDKSTKQVVDKTSANIIAQMEKEWPGGRPEDYYYQ